MYVVGMDFGSDAFVSGKFKTDSEQIYSPTGQSLAQVST